MCPESRAKPLGKEDMVHIYNGILPGYVKAQNNAICKAWMELLLLLLLLLSHFSRVQLCATP